MKKIICFVIIIISAVKILPSSKTQPDFLDLKKEAQQLSSQHELMIQALHKIQESQKTFEEKQRILVSIEQEHTEWKQKIDLFEKQFNHAINNGTLPYEHAHDIRMIIHPKKLSENIKILLQEIHKQLLPKEPS